MLVSIRSGGGDKYPGGDRPIRRGGIDPLEWKNGWAGAPHMNVGSDSNILVVKCGVSDWDS